MITPPTHQNRLLLYIETQLISMAFTAVLTFILKWLHSQLHSAPFHFTSIFGAMSGFSAIILGIGITAAMQERQSLIPSYHAIFQSPFVAAIIYGAYLAFRGPLAVPAVTQGLALVGAGTTATLAVAYKFLDGLYGNMVRAAARDNNKDGLLFLHHVCRWITTGVSSLSSSQDSSSAEELRSIGNVHIWLSMARSHQTCHVQTPEEEVTLLGDGSDTGDLV